MNHLQLLGPVSTPTCDALCSAEVAPCAAEGRGRKGGGGEGGVSQVAVRLCSSQEEWRRTVSVTVRVSASRRMAIGSAVSEMKESEERGRTVQLAGGGHESVELTSDEGRGDCRERWLRGKGTAKSASERRTEVDSPTSKTRQ